MVIGYCRVSTQHQKITRQVSNISEVYPGALMIKVREIEIKHSIKGNAYLSIYIKNNRKIK